MNDEEMVPTDETETYTEESDPLSASLPTDESGDPGAAEPDTTAEDSAISADPVQDPDPASPAPAAETAEDRLEQLRGELNRLRAEIAARDEFLGRIGDECEEFRALYPETSLSALPDGIWEDVRRGIPVAAAYALSERRRMMTEQKAAEFNRANDLRSAGALEATESDYFSPTEVRAMSQNEVRANYQKIMRSMQKWH